MAVLFDDAAAEYLVNTGSPPFTGDNPEPLSIACWFRSNEDPVVGQQALVSLSDTGTSGQQIMLVVAGASAIAGDDFRAIARTSSGNFAPEVAATSVVLPNTWHHGLGTFASTTSRAVYIDGGSKGTSTVLSSNTSLDAMDIGRLGDLTPNWEWSGDIAEVALWNIALSDADALILAAGFSPLFVRPDALVFYDPMIRLDSGDDGHDRIRGITMTGVNTPATSNHPRIIYPAAPQIVTVPAAAVTISPWHVYAQQ